jgi:class 3 adenylate cyclase
MTEAQSALRDVLDRRLGIGAADLRVSHNALVRLRRWIAVRRSEVAERADPGVDALLSLAGIDENALELAERRLAGSLEHVSGLGVSIGHLGVVGQAYTRSVHRIAWTEAEIITAVVRSTPPVQQAQLLDDLIEDAIGLSHATFELLHRAMLRDALLESLDAATPDGTTSSSVAVAHVDIVGSTRLLTHASQTQVEHLVDGLFGSAQTAVRGRPVTAIKYAGDGVFLAGSSPIDVAAAALDCIDRLARGYGLDARAGLAYGPVLQRAGDFFGLTVNLSYALTKAAQPGALLATAIAAECLPVEVRGKRMTVPVNGLEEPLPAIEILMDAARARAAGSADLQNA